MLEWDLKCEQQQWPVYFTVNCLEYTLSWQNTAFLYKPFPCSHRDHWNITHFYTLKWYITHKTHAKIIQHLADKIETQEWMIKYADVSDCIWPYKYKRYGCSWYTHSCLVNHNAKRKMNGKRKREKNNGTVWCFYTVHTQTIIQKAICNERHQTDKTQTDTV